MVLRKAIALLAVVVCLRGLRAQEVASPSMAAELVREVVYNELHDHQQHGYWRYWIARRVQRQTMLEDQVETADGPIALVTAADGRSLSAAEQQAERSRLNHLLVSPQEQARHLRQYGQGRAAHRPDRGFVARRLSLRL